MKNFWISWYSPNEPFTLHSPWWISGCTEDSDGEQFDIICAAVKADSEEDAKELIRACYDEYQDINFRFASLKSDDWVPFCDRFPKGDWMEWKI